MDFPANYILALDDLALHEHFPGLRPNINFEYTSLQTDDYNCVSWANENTDEWKQFYSESGKLLYAAEVYINYFRTLGFVETNNATLENGIIKIAIYIDTNTNIFKHVARQLSDGSWTSKLGDWEDIKHNTPYSLLGTAYGNRILFMQKA